MPIRLRKKKWGWVIILRTIKVFQKGVKKVKHGKKELFSQYF
jgi:hypothetical protein